MLQALGPTWPRDEASHPKSQLALPEEQAKFGKPRAHHRHPPGFCGERGCQYLLPFGALGKALGFISSA